jgi:hypothetical protein
MKEILGEERDFTVEAIRAHLYEAIHKLTEGPGVSFQPAGAAWRIADALGLLAVFMKKQGMHDVMGVDGFTGRGAKLEVRQGKEPENEKSIIL